MRGIKESGSLFEVPVPEYKALKQNRKELRMLKVFISLEVESKLKLIPIELNLKIYFFF